MKLFLLVIFIPSILSEFLQLNLHRHQSCPWRKTSLWQRKIEFEGGHNGAGAQLVPEEQAGCYHIKGSARVKEDLPKDLLIYLSVSTTGDMSRPPEKCHDYDPITGCGGIGSCLFCRPCDNFDGIGEVLAAQLIVDDKPIGCEPLKKGTYPNVQLRFCLPELETLVKWQGISEQALNHILAATTQDGSGMPRLSLFVTVFVFDRNVQPLISAQRKLESRIKQMRNMSENSTLDSETYWNLPFNSMIKKQSTFIACHKLYGTVSLKDALV